MAIVNICIPSYKGYHNETHNSLPPMLRETLCNCRDGRTGMPAHAPWKCTAGKHDVKLVPSIGGSSVVHWARNHMVCQGLYGPSLPGRPAAEYLLLMDDDMTVEPHYLNRLLSHKKDIVTGICTTKANPPKPTIKMWDAPRREFKNVLSWDWDSQKLMEIDASGAAFMLVKRGVFERMSDAYLSCYFEREKDVKKYPNSINEINVHWDEESIRRKEVFAQAAEVNELGRINAFWFDFPNDLFEGQVGELGEDVAFCVKAKKLGYKVYADPQVLPGHMGTYAYSIDDYRELIESRMKDEGIAELPVVEAALNADPQFKEVPV